MADWNQALKWMQEGKKVRRTVWDCECFLCIKDNYFFTHSNNLFCPVPEAFTGNDWKLFIQKPEYDPREVQLTNALEDETEYVVWDAHGNRTFAYWSGDDQCFYSLGTLIAIALDIKQWAKLPEKPEE